MVWILRKSKNTICCLLFSDVSREIKGTVMAVLHVKSMLGTLKRPHGMVYIPVTMETVERKIPLGVYL